MLISIMEKTMSSLNKVTLIEMLNKDPDVCKKTLECLEFYLHERETMPKITSFALENNNLIASQMDI